MNRGILPGRQTPLRMTQGGPTTGITTRRHSPIYFSPVGSFRNPLDRNVFPSHRTSFLALFGRTVGVFEG
jgi:hypothetical protein